MPVTTIPTQPFLTPGWVWIIPSIFIFIWAIFRFVVTPIQKKKRILRAIPYCPSLLLPQLPAKHNHISLVPSRKIIHMDYRINLYNLTCTCPRFRQVRGHYPKNDIRRLCRHLRKELEATKMHLLFDDLTRGVMAFRVRDLCYTREALHNSEMIVGFHPRSSIVRVYTYRKNPDDPAWGPFTGPVDKFTYNHSQEIWVYGEPPPNSEEILTVIDKIMTACKARYTQLNQHLPAKDPINPVMDLSDPDEPKELSRLHKRIHADTSEQTTLPLN